MGSYCGHIHGHILVCETKLMWFSPCDVSCSLRWSLQAMGCVPRSGHSTIEFFRLLSVGCAPLNVPHEVSPHPSHILYFLGNFSVIVEALGLNSLNFLF